MVSISETSFKYKYSKFKRFNTVYHLPHTDLKWPGRQARSLAAEGGNGETYMYVAWQDETTRISGSLFFLQGFAGAIAKHCTLHKTLPSRKGFACQFFLPFTDREAIRLDCDD